MKKEKQPVVPVTESEHVVMIFCPQCGATNPEKARFCDQCGAQLLSVDLTEGSGVTPPPPVASSSGMAEAVLSAGPEQCPICKFPTIPGQIFCENCGASLIVPYVAVPFSGGPVDPAALPDSPPPPQPIYPPPQPVGGAGPVSPPPPVYEPTSVVPPLPASGPVAGTGLHSLIVVALLLNDYHIRLVLPDATQVTVGRTDPISNFVPDIDLTPYDGLKSGVGRRHVRFQIHNQQVLVDDLDSTNGTFLNGRKLPPHVPHPVANNDTLVLGRMSMTIRIG